MADPAAIPMMPFPEGPPSYVPDTIRGTKLAHADVNPNAAGTVQRFRASLGSAKTLFFRRKPVQLVEGKGHKLYSPRIVATFWGDYWADKPTGKADAVEFENAMRAVQAIIDSSYMDHLTQYGPFQRAQLVVKMVVPVPPSKTPASFNQHNVSAFIQKLIDKGLNSFHESDQLLYFVFMPPSSRSRDGTVGGHHSTKFVSPGRSRVVTGRFAWVATAELKFDEITRVFSHELVEAATDPDGDGLQVLPAQKTTWNEICDKGCGCASEVGSVQDSAGRSVAVQKYWSRLHGRCVTGDEPGVPAG